MKALRPAPDNTIITCPSKPRAIENLHRLNDDFGNLVISDPASAYPHSSYPPSYDGAPPNDGRNSTQYCKFVFDEGSVCTQLRVDKT